MMTRRRLVLAVLTVAVMIGVAAHAEALMLGQTINFQYYFPDLSSPYPLADNGNKIVGAGIEVNFLNQFGIATIDISDTNLFVRFGRCCSFTPATFNGFVITDVLGTIAPFTSVTINPATNMNGFDLSRITFDANQIAVNWEGLSFTENTVVSIDINSAAPRINDLSPPSGPPGTFVTIIGENFGAVRGTGTVKFGTTLAMVNSWTNTEIGAVVPPLALGSYEVTVRTPMGDSNGIPFVVGPAPPSAVLTVRKIGKGTGRVTSSPAGIDCGTECMANFRVGKTVKLTAIADENSVLVGWNRQGCVGSRPCSVKVTAEQIIEATFVPRPQAGASKVIYVGVCGAGFIWDNTCLKDSGWYDPRDIREFWNFNPLNDDDLRTVAQLNSGLDSIGLRVGALFPNSVTLVAAFSVGAIIGDFNPFLIRQNVPSIVDVVRHFYTRGDKVYLVAHSSGGGIIQEVAKRLNGLRIPVQMTAQIDSIGLDARIPRNVTRAFNFFYPGSLLNCPATLLVEDEIFPTRGSGTIVSNDTIVDPEGPYELDEFCGGHRNMDNDERVWRPIMEYVIESSGD